MANTLEKAKLSQKIVRIAFSRAYNTFQTERERASSDIISLQVVFIRDKASQLDELSQRIRELMIEAGESEEAVCREMEHADEYAVKYHQAKLLLTPLTERRDTQGLTTSTLSQNPLPTTAKESICSLKLPKIELRRFGGDIKDWLPFWNTFKKIHEDNSLSKEDKFHYLVQSTIKDSRAFEVVNSFPLTANNYEKATQSLESRFGKKDLLIEFYVRELLKLVLNKNMSLMSIYDKLETHICALETLGVTTDMCAAMLFPLVESSLPEETLRIWQRTMTQLTPQADISVTGFSAKDRLVNVMTFLGRKVENEERIRMARTCFENSDIQTSKNKRKTKGDQECATAAGLLSIKESKTQQCLFCGENHDSVNCEKARNMKMDEKTRIVKDKNGF